jgi:hypothetical protein
MPTRRLAFILLAILMVPAALQAQEARGTIAGRVIDPSGAVVAGAEIRVTNVATGTSIAGRTNDSGNYAIPYLLPGVYNVIAELAGFKKAERAGIEVRVNDILDVSLQLQVGNVNETIEVVAAAPLLESTTVSVGQVVDGRRLTELPIQAGNAFELVLLAPGVLNTTNMRQRKAGFGNASSQFKTNGNQLYSNEFTLDGVPNTFTFTDSPQVAFQPPRSAVSEFKVNTSAYDASLGHTAGAVVNLVTKGGTNQFHGEVHEWLTNSALDSSTFFQNRAGQAKPVYQDNQYGASIGGPVLLPKLYKGSKRTFFLYAWESNQFGKPITNIGTVATAAERNGDLSALLAVGSSYQIYDPLTTTPATGGRLSRQPLANNVIPDKRIDPVARKLMAYWPAPNTPGTVDGQNNYTRATKDTMDYWVHFARLDHNFSERNRTFLRLDWDDYKESKENFYNNITMGQNNFRRNQGLALDHVLVLTPASVANFRYGITYTRAPQARKSQGFDLASLGFSPTLVSLVDKSVASFPNVYLNTKKGNAACKGTCTGTFSGFGEFDKGEGVNTGMIHNFAATLTTLRGKHNLRYGADWRAYRAFVSPLRFDVAPGLQFLPTYTKGPRDNSAAAPLGQELAAFLLGIPEGNMDRSASAAVQNTFSGLFIQDDWKLTRKLTLNLGLRYEYESPASERFDRAVRGFDWTAPSPIEAQARANYAKNPIAEIPVDRFRVLGGVMFAGPGNHALWQPDKNNLLPRLGLAYQIDTRTVLRAGYGIFYDTIGVDRSPAIQYGFTMSTPIVPSNDNGLTYVATTANPFPNGLLAPRGAADGLATNLGQDVAVYPSRRTPPYSQQWTFGVQRLLPGDFLLDANYVGNKGLRLGLDRSINQNPYQSTAKERDQAWVDYMSQNIPNPFYGLNPIFTKTTMSRSDLLRPFPEFGDVQERQPIGYSWYHALQARLEKRFAKGYTLNAAYTWSKSMDATGFLNSVDTMPNRSLSRYDRPHRLVLSGIVELPFGHGRKFAAGIPKSLDRVIGGWQLNAVVTKQSGPPLAFGDVVFRGDTRTIALPKDKRSVDRWFNTDGFEKRPSNQLEYAVRTWPRYFSDLRADGQSKYDFSLIKHFSFGERARLQFRAECYNCLNHPNLDTPDMTVTSSTFGMVSEQASTARQFQAALKLTF